MKERNLYIAAYDVRSPARLRKVLRAVKGHAIGGQKSAYECFLSDEERRDLLCELRGIIKREQDTFLLVRLDPRSRVRTLGIGTAPEDPPFFYHG